MGPILYPNCRYPNPQSSNRPVVSPCSPKYFLASPKSPPYLSPRSPHFLNPRSPCYLNPLSPKHPNYLSAPPEPQVFVDAKNKDLPYDGHCKMASNSPICLGLKQQGELLMNFLTGVPGSPLENLASKMCRLDAFNVLGDEPKAPTPCGAEGGKNFLDINRRKVAKKLLAPCHPTVVDVAVDTMDLEKINVGTDDDDIDLLLEEERAEAQRKLDMEMEEHDGKKTMTLEDYLQMVKKSTGRIGLQAQLLHELSLGEDVNLGVPDSELPAALPLEKLGTEIKPGESSQSKDQETKAIPIYRGAMRATSLVIKRLRRMAGLMHIEQQNIDLKEVYDWLQHLGYVATSSGKVGLSSAGHSSGIQSVNGERVDWRLPSSPAQALEMAQADLRDRLAYLFEEQNEIKNRKEQLEAAKRIVGRKISKTEEVGYEELGGRIVQNLDDVKGLETQFESLSKKDTADPEGKGEEDGRKERKQGKKAGKRVKGSPASGDEGTGKSTGSTKKEQDSLDENESKDSAGVSDSDQLENEWIKRKRANVEQDTNDGKAWDAASIHDTTPEGVSFESKLGERTSRAGMGRNIQHEGAGMKLKQWDNSVSKPVGMRDEGEGSIIDDERKGPIINNNEGKLLDSDARHVDKPKVPKQHVETFDKAMQTENSDLLSLMESMINEMKEEDPGGTESPAAKLKRLLRENKQMKVQLRFWRSRNWLESTIVRKLGSRSGSRTEFRMSPSLMMDSSREDFSSRDLSAYFNPIRPPSVLSQGEFSVGSSTTEDYSHAQARVQATGRARIISRSYAKEGTTRSIPSSSQPLKYPSVPSASPPNRTNTDILLETLQEMQPRHLKSNNEVFSRNRVPQGIRSSQSEPMNAEFKRALQGVQPLSSTGDDTHHSMPTRPILLEPLNAALLTNPQQGITQSPPQISPPFSSRLPSNNLQPIPAEVLNLALKSKTPSQTPRQLSSRSIPSLSFGSSERFPPGKSLSASSRTPKLSKALLPLQSKPNTSRVNAQLSPTEQVKDTSGLQALPVTPPTEHDIQPTTSPRNARNVSRNPSPRFPQPLFNSQQIHDAQAISSPSGSPPRSPRRAATQSRRGHGSANAQEQPVVENGLMIVGRKSTKK